MTNETGLLRDLNLKPGDEIYMNCDASKEIFTVIGIFDSEAFPGHYRLNGDKVGEGLYNDKVSLKWTVASRALSFKTTGTLKEIGAKVGDVVKDQRGYDFTVCQLALNHYVEEDYTIISRATTSPVRTVTKREIVPGVYGDVRVDNLGCSKGSIEITINSTEMFRDDLTEAINTLTEIRDALV